eukprot:s3_g53.t1
MTDKCCSSSWSMGFCCSDSRNKNGEDEALPIPMPQTQMQKPPTEHMPLPEEDTEMLLTKAFSQFDTQNMSTSRKRNDL